VRVAAVPTGGAVWSAVALATLSRLCEVIRSPAIARTTLLMRSACLGVKRSPCCAVALLVVLDTLLVNRKHLNNPIHAEDRGWLCPTTHLMHELGSRDALGTFVRQDAGKAPVREGRSRAVREERSFSSGHKPELATVTTCTTPAGSDPTDLTQRPRPVLPSARSIHPGVFESAVSAARVE
jgi:hypothetical protein